MDEHTLAFPEAGQVYQGIVRGHVDRQDRGALHRIQGRGFGEHGELVDHHAVGNASAHREHNLVARTEVPNLRPHTANDPAAFDADVVFQGRMLKGGGRQHVQGHHHIAEVQGRGRHLDFDAVGFECRQFTGHHPETVQLPGIDDVEPKGRIPLSAHRLEQGVFADNPRRPQALVAHRQFALAHVQTGQPFQDRQIIPGPQIHQPKLNRGLHADFGGHAPHRPPENLAPRMPHVHHRALRDHGQTAGIAFVPQPQGHQRLHERKEAGGHPFARGIIGIRTAEEVDGLHGGQERPLFQRIEIARIKQIPGHEMHVGGFESSSPRSGPASPLTQDPPGRGARFRFRMLDEFPRHPQQCGFGLGADRGPTGFGMDDGSRFVQHQGQASRDRQPTQQPPTRGIRRNPVTMDQLEFRGRRTQQPVAEHIQGPVRGVDGFEAQGHGQAMEFLKTGLCDFRRVRNQPILGAVAGLDQCLDTLMERSLTRLPTAGPLHHTEHPAGAALTALQGCDDSGRACWGIANKG